jgi:hypothetical protein
MHLTLKQETTRPAAANSLAQQARFDEFVETFNTERPHEALAMRTPASAYEASPRPFPGLPELAYPFHDLDAVVAPNGTIGLHGRRVVISTVFAGQTLGLREVDTDVWLVSFMHYASGIHRSGGEITATHRHPVRLEGVTHVIGTKCHLCPRTGQRQEFSLWITRSLTHYMFNIR